MSCSIYCNSKVKKSSVVRNRIALWFWYHCSLFWMSEFIFIVQNIINVVSDSSMMILHKKYCCNFIRYEIIFTMQKLKNLNVITAGRWKHQSSQWCWKRDLMKIPQSNLKIDFLFHFLNIYKRNTLIIFAYVAN